MGKKVLFITPHDIYDLYGNGGVKATQRNYKLLQDYFGDENTYLCSFPRNDYVVPPKDAIAFKRTQNNFEYLLAALFGCKVYFLWDEKKIIDYIESLNIDLVFIDSSILGRLTTIKKHTYKTIVFFHNIERDYALNKVRNEGIKYLPSYTASVHNDKCAVKADGIICLNLRDSARLDKLYGRKADFLLPITFSDIYNDKSNKIDKDRKLLFVGSKCAPNEAGVQWFVKEVMPLLKDITLTIVGKGFETYKKVFADNKKVKVVGSVDDLGQYYYSYAAVVMPILYGAGMKVKTAEAMMYGKTIFATDEALEGYETESVCGIFRCNAAAEFATSINHFFETENFLSINKSVRKVFLEKYESSAVKEKFFQYIADMIGVHYG